MTGGLFMHRGHNQGRSFAVYRARVARANLNAFAEALAEIGTITGAAQHLGISQQRGSQLFAKIRRELGWQAQ